jgi:hypothetical protein
MGEKKLSSSEKRYMDTSLGRVFYLLAAVRVKTADRVAPALVFVLENQNNPKKKESPDKFDFTGIIEFFLKNSKFFWW